MNDSYRFPEGFLWGAATSAYQIEGSPLADGAGPSIWQRFAHTPGLTHERRHRRRRLRPLRRYARRRRADGASSGSTRYRFSIAWSRVLPEGTRPGQRARARLLRAAGRRAAGERHRAATSRSITGICRPRSTTAAAGSIATSPTGSPTTRRSMSDALGDRVPMWATLNEPWVVDRRRLPRTARSRPATATCSRRRSPAHNLLRAHGAAVQAYRAAAKQTDRTGGEPRAEVPGVRVEADDLAATGAPTPT